MGVVVRALSVLTYLSRHRQGKTLQQLRSDLDIPLGSAHRLMATLEHEEFVRRSAGTKRYMLGSAALGLGQQYSSEAYLLAPPPALVKAGKVTGETVFLTQMIDTRVMCVSLVQSVHRLRLYVHVGQVMPPHAAASARVILAYRDPAVVEALLSSYPKEVFTPGTVREVNRLIDHLAETRVQGFDVCDSELDDDVWAVAAPVFDSRGTVECGVTLAAAWTRVREPETRALATLTVMRAADELSAEQGYIGPWPRRPSRDELIAKYARDDEGAWNRRWSRCRS
jgi:DNA-binding IclR family transcriptional regulator